MAEQSFDLVILGGGSGGYAAALRASQLGMTVALVEKSKLGGTCLHVGCIPTKALLHSAEVADVTRDSAKYGVTSTYGGVDIAAVTAYREEVVASKYKGLQGLIKARGITVFEGEGKLASPTSVQVGDTTLVGKNVDPRHRVVLPLAARSGDRRPGHHVRAGTDPRLRAEEGRRARRRRDRCRVLQRLALLGRRGHDRRGLPHLVPNEDEAISKQFERAFRKRGIDFKVGVKFQSVTQNDEGVVVTLENGETVEGDLLLVAVGRGPVTADLGFEEAGITMDRGFVITNERLQTSVPTVYAVGDIVPGLQLAHRGFQQGIFVAEELAGLNPVVIEDVNIPKVTYSDPEVASVGLTEAKAIELHGADKVTSYDYNLAGNGKSHIIGTSGLGQGRPGQRRPGRRRPHDRRPRRRAHRRRPARGQLGGLPGGHRAAHPRAPHAERSAGRSIPCPRGQAPARDLTTHDRPNYSRSTGPRRSITDERIRQPPGTR